MMTKTKTVMIKHACLFFYKPLHSSVNLHDMVLRQRNNFLLSLSLLVDYVSL